MADYTPTTWTDGDLITAEKLNHIESGIQQSFSEITDIEKLPMITLIKTNVSGEITTSNDITYSFLSNNDKKCVLVKEISINNNNSHNTVISYYFCYLYTKMLGNTSIRYYLPFLAQKDADTYVIKTFYGNGTMADYTYSLSLSDSEFVIRNEKYKVSGITLNLNSLGAGNYYYNSAKIGTLTNCPTDPPFIIDVITYDDDPNLITQCLKRCDGVCMYMRGSADGGTTWNNWREFGGTTPTVITTQPQDKNIFSSSTTLTVEAEGTNLSYQWQIGGYTATSTYTDISGQTSATCELTGIALGTTYYRCVITNGNGATLTTRAVKVNRQNF